MANEHADDPAPAFSGVGADTSIHYAPRPEDAGAPVDKSARRSDLFFPSKRLRARGGESGLFLKITVPIIVAVLIGGAIVTHIIHDRVFSLQIEDLKNDAANAAYANGILGRLYLVHREKFLRNHPEYPGAVEWPTGDHWLIADDLVEPERWVSLTGFGLNEKAPVPILEEAAERAILSGMDDWLNSPMGNTEMAAAFLLSVDGAVLAASVNDAFPVEYADLKAVPTRGEYRSVGGIQMLVDYIDDFQPEPVIRGMARIMSPSEPDRRLGSSVVVMRTVRHREAKRGFLILSSCLLAGMAAFIAAASWLAIRKVTGPMRRLAHDMQAMAEGDFSRRAPPGNFKEMGLLSQSFNSMAERLRVARVNEMETSRLESDLATARNIQNNLLPLQTPRIRGLDIFTSYRPAREIGGDYFDFLPVDSQHMGIVVADASGKSIPAALVMSTTRAILRFVAPGGESAAETLTKVNAILSVDIPRGMFVTAYYIILDPLDNTMVCSSAGHTPLLLGRADGTVELLNPGGIALGFDSGPIFQRSISEQRVRLEAGDRVLLYTDGVVECVNTANEEYSERRLREFVRRNRDLSSHDFVGALLTDIDRHRGAADMRDDTTIVTFKVL